MIRFLLKLIDIKNIQEDFAVIVRSAEKHKDMVQLKPILWTF